MDIFNELYYKSVAENERNLRFWDDYLQSLKSLDFNAYSEKLKVPVLVPVGSRIFFRGELKHTNEVTVALGADYFVKCSLQQANTLRQHRIKGAQERVDTYNKEKEYLQNQMSFTKQNIYENQGEEIIEYHTEEEDRSWREKHKANVKEYMQKRGKENEMKKPKDDMTDEELWNRLEELELQEELESELNMEDDEARVSHKKESFIIKEDSIKVKDLKSEDDYKIKDKDKAEKEMKNKKVTFNEGKGPGPSAKFDLLQQVIDRQNELDEKLQEIKNRERAQSKTEKDLMSRLDEMEQLDELEDEMDRLDDIIENEDIEESEEEEETSKSNTNIKLERRVSFIDEDDSETIDLMFSHSKVEPNSEPYDPKIGIQKPSDIYEAHSNLFDSGKKSILKKSKYATDDQVPVMMTKPIIKVEKDTRKQAKQVEQSIVAEHDHVAPQTIVVKDIVEKVRQEDIKLPSETRPMSLFKKKRMQNKS